MYDNRVRAVILNDESHLVLIKRLRPGVAPYWVIPGGGLEPTDSSLEAALQREIREELGAEIRVIKLLRIEEFQIEEERFVRQYIYLCRLIAFVGTPNGPEFDDPARGQFLRDEIPCDRQAIAALNLRPEPLKNFLVTQVDRLELLPDLRDSR